MVWRRVEGIGSRGQVVARLDLTSVRTSSGERVEKEASPGKRGREAGLEGEVGEEKVVGSEIVRVLPEALFYEFAEIQTAKEWVERIELTNEWSAILRKEGEEDIQLIKEVTKLTRGMIDSIVFVHLESSCAEVDATADASQAAELIQRNQTCRDLQKELNAQKRCLLEKESEVQSLKQQLDNSHNDLDNLIASICTKENDFRDQKLWKQTEADIQRNENTCWRLEDSSTTPLQLLQSEESTPHKECPDHHKAVKTLLDTQEECERLKEEICETLKCLDKERSKCHEMNEKHKAKLNRAKLKFDDETKWRDEKMKNLERELSLCAHSLAKEKELIINMTVENEKLLIEKRTLLQQLNEEEHIKNDSILTASLSKYRVDFLEMENKRLGNKILQMSNQLAVLERTLQNMRSLHFAEELKKISNPQHVSLTSSPLQPSSVMMPESSEIRGLLDNIESSKTKQTEVTSSPLSAVTMRPAEMGYLNLTSTNSRSDQSAPSGFLSSTDNSCS
ncbi:coiled-coil domain-containing protein 30-like [Centroberyx affinis]|uniref:coiled-coil domain-containing protein 30-like n=1 Tax=Centroberyx affinis TaxID=166261 RepID=UPI003A5C5DB0